jgi:hypothetical protein
MKKIFVILLFLFVINGFTFGLNLFFNTGIGYTSDENVGLGFVNSAKGFYFGTGAGLVFGYSEDFNFVTGVHIDFLGKPQMEFIRGEEHYDIESLSDQVSLRVMPYIELSSSVGDLFYMGVGLGYGFTSIYFGMPPQMYDIDTTSYNSYKMQNESVTPVLFIRYFLSQFYVTLNYECDIVVKGNIKKLSGDPFDGDIDGSDNIEGLHHRVRFALGFVLGGDN